MRKDSVVNLLHVSVYFLFIFIYFFFEEQDMVGSIMYHVDSNSNAAPFRNHALFAVVALTSLCALLGRWPRTRLFMTLSVLYAVTISIAAIHGPEELKGAIGYVLFIFSLILPILLYVFGYNMSYKIQQKTADRGIIIGILLLGAFYALTMKDVFVNYFLIEGYRDGTVYVFMMFLPLVMTIRKAKIRYIIIAFIALAVLTSMKRGGFVTVLFSLLVYMLTLQRVTNKRIPPIVKLIALVLFLIGLVGVIIYVNTQSGGMIFERFAKAGADGGSGRDKVYLISLEMILASEPFGLFFGHGWNSLAGDSPLGLSAHNDYLEITYDIGLFGLILLLAFLFHLGIHVLRLVRQKSPLAPAFVASFIIFFFTSMTAHVYLYLLNMSALMLFWGYAGGKLKQEKEQQEDNVHEVSLVEQTLPGSDISVSENTPEIDDTQVEKT